MPWPAVPFWDQECRVYVETTLYLTKELFPFSIIVHPSGKVLSGDGICSIKMYGAEGFPWTYDSLHDVGHQDYTSSKQPSLRTLLASSDRDFLIAGDGRQVPIFDLEEKVVGLYFYIDGTDEQLTEKLKVACQELKAQGEDFEVVLINLEYAAHHTRWKLQSFWENIRSMPWLALPFMDPNIKKLRRIFEYPDLEVYCEDPSRVLVIIRPNGSGTELYGADIFERYAIEAYPFTQKKAAELEAAELRKLKLDSILDPGVVLTRGKDNAQIPLRELAGKRVLLLFAVELFFKSNEFVYLNQKKCSKFFK